MDKKVNALISDEDGVEGDSNWTINFEEVSAAMRMTLGYYLSEEIAQEKTLISAPEVFSDNEMLAWLWRRAVGEVQVAIREGVTLCFSDDDKTQVCLLVKENASERKAGEIRELILFSLVSAMARDWLFVTNRKDVTHFASSAEKAMEAAVLLARKSDGKSRASRPCGPF